MAVNLGELDFPGVCIRVCIWTTISEDLLRVVAAPEALTHIARSGGSVYLWAKETRCCGQRTSVLEVATEPGGRDFEQIYTQQGLAIWATRGLLAPTELHLDLSRRGALRAFWNGQAWIG
jgi:hypothetical protein